MTRRPEIGDQLLDYWKRYGISLEKLTEAMNLSSETIEKLIEQMEDSNHEEAG